MLRLAHPFRILMTTLSRALPTNAGPLGLAIVGAGAALGTLVASLDSGPGWPVALLFLVTGVILVAMPVRLPESVLSFLPAVLIPAWLSLGLVATALLAPAAVLIGAVIRGGRPEVAVVGAVLAFAGVVVGAITSGAVRAVDLLPGSLPERIIMGASFAAGYWVAERLGFWIAARSWRADDLRRLPRVSLIANLLLVWPGVILTDVLMTRGVVLFGLLLAVLVAALVLIALYLGADTARLGVAGERERLQSIVSQVPDGIFTVRPDLTVDWLNDTAASLVGWEPDDAIGRACDEVIPSRAIDGGALDHGSAFRESARTGQPVHTRALVRARDGTDHTVIVSYTSMGTADDDLEIGIATVREVPAIQDDRDAQISALGHELRSPLTAILGYAQLMQREVQSPAGSAHSAEYAERIAASGDYMLRLVNNLLDLRRMESGAETLQPTPIRLDRILQVVLSLARLGASQKQVETVLSVEPDLPPFVTDELLLRRTVDNLLSNAIKYTPSGGSVRVTVERRDGGVEIAVADSGIGISDDEQARLFERFFRSSRPEARQERGTGLGLALAQESVRRLGGEITVTSQVGEGSTFSVWLPPLGPSSGLPMTTPSTGASPTSQSA
jgi:PAS domain S-box-containing protein